MTGQHDAEKRRAYYLAKAEEAEARAFKIKNEEVRLILLTIAESWRLLAERIRDYPE